LRGGLLDFEGGGLTLEVVDLGGDGADLDGEGGGGLVDQIDGLVRQEAVGDVAVGEGGGGDEGRVLDADLVVRLVALAQAAQDGDGVFDVGLADEDDWKRRSRAASFSIYLRYSLRVVAPMARRPPRASAGLSMLLASIAPSAAPAPTRVCSSSMKRMISPLLSSISSGEL